MAASPARSFYKNLPAVPAETGMCETALQQNTDFIKFDNVLRLVMNITPRSGTRCAPT